MKASSPELNWFKSSYSSGSGGDCVEIANAGPSVLIRDSKRPKDAILTVGTQGWTAFIRMAARG
ncbi:DUF397 domain-containing protein [Streptomyces sp. NPDC048002]|uniref:DUF397 domain-containing protein n=1 Tax=Streptomyces sp. NPDC048002 TaxID=3154344 RepID=UPI0033EA1FF5